MQGGRFTAGMATQYRPSLLTGSDEHQALATGYPVGQRFHSAPVVRLADAKPMQLGHVARADGRWRFYAFADAAVGGEHAPRLRALMHYLDTDAASPINRFTAPGHDRDSVFDVRAIFPEYHRDLSIQDMPEFLRPAVGKLGLWDYEKAFTSDHKLGVDIFDLRGVNRTEGALIVVRPDQYVAQVLPLDVRDELGEFFGAFMTPQA
jgi:phenol 2-monooxygenase